MKYTNLIEKQLSDMGILKFGKFNKENGEFISKAGSLKLNFIELTKSDKIIMKCMLNISGFEFLSNCLIENKDGKINLEKYLKDAFKKDFVEGNITNNFHYDNIENGILTVLGIQYLNISKKNGDFILNFKNGSKKIKLDCDEFKKFTYELEKFGKDYIFSKYYIAA